MKLEIDIPDKLAPAIAQIICDRDRDDDGVADAMIMRDHGLTVEEKVEADRLFGEILAQLELIDRHGQDGYELRTMAERVDADLVSRFARQFVP